jgi:NADH-quinone oxidoreductase subunit F
VLPIVLDGGVAFAGIGTERSTGPKRFCVCGAVEEPGTYEVPFGTTLGELLDLAGGVNAGRLCARCRSAAPPAASSPPTTSTFR